jgi:hypothetical protein
MSLEVIPLQATLESSQYSGANDQKVLVTLLQKLSIPSEESARGLPVPSESRIQIRQRVANTVHSLTHCNIEICKWLPKEHTYKGQPFCNSYEENNIQILKPISNN